MTDKIDKLLDEDPLSFLGMGSPVELPGIGLSGLSVICQSQTVVCQSFVSHEMLFVSHLSVIGFAIRLQRNHGFQ